MLTCVAKLHKPDNFLWWLRLLLTFSVSNFFKIIKSHHKIAHYIYFVLKKKFFEEVFSCGVIANFVFCMTKMLIPQGVR